MEQKMPMVSIKWRPLNCPAVTKNVIISVNANGALQHWHVTSGKLLNTIFDEFNQLLTVDYNNDGTKFVAAGNDCVVRVYDEKVLKCSRALSTTLEGGGSGAPGHSNRVFCCKFDPDNSNHIISGGWDNTIMIWDVRTPGGPVRSIFEPYICGDSIDIHDGYLLTGSHKADK
jgi:WD40 repeat protein